MSRRKKHHNTHHEEHMDESWLIPYADILTLLLALFIVLFATAQVDQKKFDQMAYAFNTAFSGSPSLFDKNQAITSEMEAAVPNQNMESSQDQLRETVQLAELKKQIDRYIQENKLTGDLNTILTEDGLMIRIKDSALFTSGNANLRSESLRMGEEIGKVLVPLSQKIVISGHTDNIPINTAEFPSNWELSSKRAINFMKFILASEKKLQPERFSAIGYGEYRPLQPNDTIDGRSKNRRVEVLIMRNYKK
ncbi:MAG: Motility protein N-terminal domain containing protein [Pelosinus sp.]|jgi:chemotaxis protein MotB|nr:Motility protein N-terminal domain containing protein [Pelosinus sp.]